MARKMIGLRTRTTLSADRGGSARILRSGAVAHMKELVNRGSTTNARYRIRRK
jgi:hypothetical protein